MKRSLYMHRKRSTAYHIKYIQNNIKSNAVIKENERKNNLSSNHQHFVSDEKDHHLCTDCVKGFTLALGGTHKNTQGSRQMFLLALKVS